MYRRSQQIAEQESVDQKQREHSVAEALKLRHKSDTPADEFYPTFLDIARNLLDGNMDSATYEDQLREMFGIHAYIVFTLDKVVHNCVRQLQYLVQDEKSVAVRLLYAEEAKPASGVCSGAGGKLANMSYANVMSAELAYQKKAEALLSDEYCYKVIIYKNSCRLTIELLDTQGDEEADAEALDDVDVEKWSEYIDKHYVGGEAEVKARLLQRPVLLTRNAHILKCKHGVYKAAAADPNVTNEIQREEIKAAAIEDSNNKNTAIVDRLW